MQHLKEDSGKLSLRCSTAKCAAFAKVDKEYTCFGKYCSAEIGNIIIGNEQYFGNYKLISRIENVVLIEKNQTISFDSKYEDFINTDLIGNLYSLSNSEIGVFKYPTKIVITNDQEYFSDSISLNSILNLYRRQFEVEAKNVLGENYGLLLGILFGDKSYYNIYKSEIIQLGLAHVFVVSGFNLGVIIYLLTSFATYLGRKRVIYIGFVFAIIFLFMIDDQNIPALRAFVMLAIISLVKLLGFNIKTLPCLTFCIFLFAAINPFVIFQISFQLTFLALIGIIYFTTSIEEWISLLIPKAFSSIVASTISATLFTSPVIIYYFGNFSLFGIISSIFTLVLVEIITILGVIFFIFSWSHLIASIVGLGLSPWLDLFVWTISFLEDFSFSLKINPGYFWVPIILICFLLLSRIYKDYLKHISFIGNKI